MKKFNFSLEQVLKIRSWEVLKRQEQLQKLQEEYAFLKSEIRFLEKENHSYKNKIFHNALSSHERSFVPKYLAEIAQALVMYRTKIQELELEIIHVQNDLLNAVKERKKIEKLKEKQYALWQNQEKQREENLLDAHHPKKNIFNEWMNQI